VVALWLLVPPAHDLGSALQLATTFLQAQRAAPAGALPGAATLAALPPYDTMRLEGVDFSAAALARYPWLAAGATESPRDLVSGGFFMGGDFVKHTLPLATNLALLAWSVTHFAHAYARVRAWARVRSWR
jgi:hypothetical protein